MDFKFTNPLIKTFFLCLAFFVTACQSTGDPTTDFYQTNDFSNEVATEWVKISLDLAKNTPGYTPPVVSRSFGYLGVAMYESAVAGIKGNISLAGQLSEMPAMPKIETNKNYYWPACVNAAAYTILKKMYSNAPADFHTVMDVTFANNNNRFKNATDADVYSRSVDYGISVATEVFKWSATDIVGHEGYLKNTPQSYVPPVGEGLWEPTTSGGKAIQPYWGTVRSFIPSVTTKIAAPVAVKFNKSSSSLFYNYADRVYKIVNEKNPEYQKIALYWADNAKESFTPPGHVFSVASQVVDEQKQSLGKALETYARVGMVVADAFICCWKTKFDNSLLRPETYIQKYIDPSWKPLFATPMFPTYTSGHASCSGAGFELLSAIYGYNYAFIDRSHLTKYQAGDATFAPRAFRSFEEAANEAATSRLYGGIHYEFDNADGLKVGRAIATLQMSEIRFR